MNGFVSMYLPSFPATLIYMLQSTEYEPGPYLRWFWRTQNFSLVSKRRTLDRTRRAQLLLRSLQAGIMLQLAVGIAVVGWGIGHNSTIAWLIGLLLLISYPVVWAHLAVVPLSLARWLIVKPKERRLVSQSAGRFGAAKGVKIAVAGSYGKTTMKELLLAVLSAGKNVAATPANKNVASSHAIFASKLTGDEEIIIIEYGEGAPGDVAAFARTTQPDIGVITGLAPAHLDKYKSLKAAGEDIFSLADYLQEKPVYVNGESVPMSSFIKPQFTEYTRAGVAGWKVSDVVNDITGLRFTITNGKRKLKLHSQLIGEHLVGSLAACVALAADQGLTDKQIIEGVGNTKPFEHRMQPRPLAGGWVIDDTYNGNLEGVRAGLALLRDLSASRRIYVTPGLVDQGKEVKRVHIEVGELIAQANPDKVVLMQNSVTGFIQSGLERGKYTGDVSVQDDPLAFYQHLDQFMAAGDVVLMQNDWTDNYN